MSINPAGTVTGYYADANYNYYGFVRDSKGNITTIDLGNSNDTEANGINQSGTVEHVPGLVESGGSRPSALYATWC